MRKKNSHGYKTLESPPPISELVNFEHELFDMVKNVAFRKTSNALQERLKKDWKDLGKQD